MVDNLSDMVLSQEEGTRVQMNLATLEDIARERAAANPDPAPSTDPVPAADPADPITASDPAPVTDPVDPTPATDPAPTSGLDLSDLGINTKEEVIEAFAELNKYRAKQAEFTDFDRIKTLLEDPYGEDAEAAKAMAIKKDLKIPLKLAADIAALSQEDLLANPLKALAYRDIMNNPVITSKMGVDELMAIHAKKLNIDLSDENALKDSTLIYEATMALSDVTKKLDAYSTAPTSPIKAIQEKQNIQLQEVQERKEKLAKVFDIAVSKKNTVEKSYKETKVSVAVKPQDLMAIKEETVSYLASKPDATPQDLLSYVNRRLEFEYQEQLEEQLEKTLAKKFEEEAVKKAHNGQPVTRTEKPVSTEDEDPSLVAYREQMKAIGMNVEGFNVKRRN